MRFLEKEVTNESYKDGNQPERMEFSLPPNLCAEVKRIIILFISISVSIETNTRD